MPEKLTIGALAERVDGIVRVEDERHRNVVSSIEKIVEDQENFEEKIEKEVEETNDKIIELERSVSTKFGAMELAAVNAERRVQTENEKNRISRNRWMIGTVLTVAIAVLGFAIDLLKG